MDFPEYQQIITKYPAALTINELTAENIVSAIRQIIDQPKKYDEMKKACMEAQKEFYWEKEEKKLIDITSPFLIKS
jgi:glycosyltransferase involved in cell wall biosynthesis